MARPAVYVVLAQLHRQAVGAVRTTHLGGHHGDREGLVAGGNWVAWSKVTFRDLDQAEERLRFLEVVSFDAFNKGLALQPCDRVDTMASKDVTPADAVTEAKFLTVDGHDGSPATSEVLNARWPLPRKRSERRRA
jgi:hypothetical protein